MSCPALRFPVVESCFGVLGVGKDWAGRGGSERARESERGERGEREREARDNRLRTLEAREREREAYEGGRWSWFGDVCGWQA